MKLSEFDYDLPEDLIAQAPLDDRAGSRLMIVDKRTGGIRHTAFREITSLVAKDDVLVVNDTRVTALRLFGHRPSGGKVEALLLSREGPGLYVALMRPGKRLKVGERVAFEGQLDAQVEQDLGSGQKLLKLLSERSEEIILGMGRIPLPPYVHTELEDAERYQTVYGTTAGSAAAPTAGLHFTDGLLSRLRDQGTEIASVTLDVSIDTFRPVTSDSLEGHTMHGERCSVPEATARAVQECKGRVVAVGTTTARTLETFAVGPHRLCAGEQVSKIFISPGYRFQIVDAMLTNFHMPKTTMLMMVSAMTGVDPLMRAYKEAVSERYRFLSFGDSMLIQ